MRFYTIVMMTVGIILLLNLAGINSPLGGGVVRGLGIIDSDNNVANNIEGSDLYGGDTESNKGLKFLLTAALVAGLAVGLLGGAPDIRYVTAGVVWIIITAVTTDVLFIIDTVRQSGGFIETTVMMLMGGLLAALYISAIQFWQGTD